MIIDILFPESKPENLKDYGLVMPESVRDSLLEKQEQFGNPNHKLSPVKLINGDYALNADVLSEARKDGLFGSVEFLDENQIKQVMTKPWTEVIEMLPKPEEDL